MPELNGLRLAVDIGGTFTDTVLVGDTGEILATTKTPATPENPTLGALDGARRGLCDADAEWRCRRDPIRDWNRQALARGSLHDGHAAYL